MGHLYRTNEMYACRKLMSSKPEGIERVEQPTGRWLDSFRCGLQIFGIYTWRGKALDRNMWNIIEVVKAYAGLDMLLSQLLPSILLD
jgi:hypothetical protein